MPHKMDEMTEWVDCLRINDSICIPQVELQFNYTRSGGPGGQHVNKTESAVELTWNFAASGSVDEFVRARLWARLSDGMLRVEASTERSQLRNRDEAMRKLAQRVREALVIQKKRRPTKPSRASKERRLEGKRLDSATKQNRRASDHE